ncbi:M20/M25/M40 family metallo-hydrolase [Nocardioides sp. ChNu-99]|uniref:M20/M25/M40 family metallo-hydrolase n=1 Tax=Nocardioides sp. ChNu-99 TaxID=2839897 RepID=UPI0024056D71|nr:M20/M25/M40 family metallo-hydrolase [Nocardioides sp. ChNu-99]MDF9717202.1 M20/M25/M40 family metallo-hydrolase [Nocardioides sp. ChNu-99]
MTQDAQQAHAGPAPSARPEDDPAVAALRALVRVPTVSRRAPDTVEPGVFARLHDELATHFPLLHEHLELVRVGGDALLFRWRGTGGGPAVVLMAHLDVVPVDGEAPWTHPAFDAVVADSPEGRAVWGRGTLDDKGSVVGVCAAVERLLAEGFTPARDVWLSFGSDEEVSGTTAQAAVDHLRDAGVAPWFVLDEGGAVAGGAFPGVTTPMAVVGVSEKGTTLFEVRATGRGGHSSTPARNGPTARVARAVLAIDRAPMPARLPAPAIELFRRLAPHAPAPLRVALAAAGGRLTPLLTRVLAAAGPEAAALTRTTLATTMLSGSPAPNVIASTATAVVNARILVGDTVASVHEHLRRVVGDHAEVSVLEPGEPSPVSPYADDPAFALLETTTAEVFPEAVPTPYVMMAATDSRHFTAICERVYRFAPFPMSKAQREAIHSYDERLTVEGLLRGVDWYAALLRGLPA